ncbi:MAG: class I SAM-dependent methyltransferase [Phycisphaerae bacterium]|jgi:SAM-dependent methyltransferase|nr:class I SAM-dependent methyltransferase [Phycisphaerae bacterium]
MAKSRQIRHHYQPRIATRKENYDVVDWASAEAQHIRFTVLTDNVSLDGRTVLDVGCGLGDLWIYLKERGISADYCGVDLLEEMTASAAQQSPDARFVSGDIFDPNEQVMDPPERFNVVFCSGTLNLELGNNTEFLPEALNRMLELSTEHMVVNLLHTRCRMRYPHCAYYDPDEVLRILEPMPCKVRLIDDYLPNDFTVICNRNDP